MGVCYRPILAIGVLFDEIQQAESFLRDNFEDDSEVLKQMESTGLVDFCAATNPIGLDGDVVDCYIERDYGFWIGRELDAKNVEEFTRQIKKAHDWWKSTFPGVEPQIVNTVGIY